MSRDLHSFASRAMRGLVYPAACAQTDRQQPTDVQGGSAWAAAEIAGWLCIGVAVIVLLFTQVRTAIAAVMQRFTCLTEGLGRSLATIDGESAQVREQIAEVQVALQFQDRANQILGHIAANLDKFGQHIAAGTLDNRVGKPIWL